MFTSHILLAHEMLQDILTDEVMRSLYASIGDDAQPADYEILELLDKLRGKVPLPTIDDILESTTTEPKQNSSVDEQIINNYQIALSVNTELRNCKQCSASSYSAYILTCTHIHCTFCFPRLAKNQNGVVCRCGPTIQAYTFCSAIPSLYGSALAMRDLVTENTIQQPPNASRADEGTSDKWILAAGHLMPSAKLTAIRSLVANWLNGDPDTKVTIFTQFLGMVDILSCMCLKEGWGHTTVRLFGSFATGTL